jgi:hypothetical protein
MFFITVLFYLAALTVILSMHEEVLRVLLPVYLKAMTAVLPASTGRFISPESTKA